MDQLGQINQFSHWNTDELKQWIEDYINCPLLHTINNINTYYEAEKELDKREESYGQHQCKSNTMAER